MALQEEQAEKKEKAHGGHATPKPIALCSRAIKSSSREEEIVLDLFGGSGSTLIACEQLNRTCYMMEIDPVYCDVIIKRWENLHRAKGGAGRVKRVFISHPFTSDPEGKQVRVDIICRDLVKQGDTTN